MAMVQRPLPLTECPRSPDSLYFAAYWYRIPHIPDFLICTKCFEDKIAQTQFAPSFESFYLVPVQGKPATCMFNGMTMERIFGEALRSPYGGPGALSTFFATAENRARVIPCPGIEGAGPEAAIRWFGLHQIPDFMVCEACYLQNVCGSMFVANFVPYPTIQPAGQVWACDMAISSIRSCLVTNSPRHDWAGFVNVASHRLHQPRCDGSDQSLTRRNWYTPKAIPNMLICETCYLDEVSMTPSSNEFCHLRSNWTSFPPSHVTGRCMFNKISVQICNNQLLERNFGQWLQLTSRILTLPPCCESNSILNGDWFVLVNPWTHQATEFGLCESCYIGCIESSNNGHVFRRQHLPGLRYCELNPTNPRLGDSVAKITELLFTRDTSRLIDYAVHLQPRSLTTVPAFQSPAPPPPPPPPPPTTSSSLSSGTNTNQQQQQQTWQALSAKLSQQHAMKMSMNSMLFNQNSMHNAAMAGIWNQGSMYDKWHDPTYTTAQWNYTQAQGQLFGAMGGAAYASRGGVGGGSGDGGGGGGCGGAGEGMIRSKSAGL